jgi:predicted SnoaL-like aldol condensation-catalyzing enzyme
VDGVCELNKQKVRLFIGAVLNEGRLEMIDELLAADYVGHFPGVPVVGRDAMRALVSSRRQEYPGLFVEVEDQVAEEDRVVTRWLVDVPRRTATGSRNFLSGISIVRLLAGKQVDSYTQLTCPVIDRSSVERRSS